MEIIKETIEKMREITNKKRSKADQTHKKKSITNKDP
jgi:hypothetical protein